MVDNEKPNLTSGSFSPTSFSGTSFSNFHYVSKPDERIIANVSGQNVNISGEVKELEIKTQDNSPSSINIHYQSINTINYQSFNPTSMNQNIFENNSIENILTIVNNQQNISGEDKSKLQEQIKEFELESKKNSPDRQKLRNILNFITPIAKEVGMRLFFHAFENGLLKF
jgi:hypothetical protein